MGRGFRRRGLLVGEFGDCLGPEEVLVGAQIAHGLDVERLFEVLGIARARLTARSHSPMIDMSSWFQDWV